MSHPEKRTVAVKVMLKPSEALELHLQADAQDAPAADVLRKSWLRDSFGSVGLARLRAKRSRGSDEFLQREDFEPSGFGDMETGQAR